MDYHTVEDLVGKLSDDLGELGTYAHIVLVLDPETSVVSSAYLGNAIELLGMLEIAKSNIIFENSDGEDQDDA